MQVTIIECLDAICMVHMIICQHKLLTDHQYLLYCKVFIIIIIIILLLQLYNVYLNKLKFPQVGHLIEPHAINCSDDGIERTVYELHISSWWCLGIPTLTIILIPILDRIFYTMQHFQWVFNRITVGMCFSILSIVCALALEVWRYHYSESLQVVNAVKYPDYLRENNYSVYYFASDISIRTIIPQFLFQGVTEAFSLRRYW